MAYNWTEEEKEWFLSQIEIIFERICHNVVKFSQEWRAEIDEREKKKQERRRAY